MPDKIITVDEASGIPLYGLDFLGILDKRNQCFRNQTYYYL